MKKYLLLLLIISALSCNNEPSNKPQTNTTQTNIDGEQLFKAQCANCHKCFEDFTGPALHGAFSRWKDKRLLYDFVRNPQGIINKDKYADSLYKKYLNLMPDFPNLTNVQIEAILLRCDFSDPPTH